MSFNQKSVAFGGSNEYVSMGSAFAFERTQEFTFSLWVKTNPQATAGILLSRALSSGTYRGYWLYLQADGMITAALHSTYTTNSLVKTTVATGATDGGWHHIVVTYNGLSLASGLHVYLDGAGPLALTSTIDLLSATIVDAGAVFVLGARTGGTSPFTGSLDEVSVYSRALSSMEVIDLYNGGVPTDLKGVGAPANLAGWWRMGEGDTPPVLLDSVVADVLFPDFADFSGNGIVGTATAMEPGDVTAYSAPPFSYRCLWFRGPSVFTTISVGNRLAYERTQPFSISVWVRYTAAGYIVGKGSGWSAYRGYWLSIESDGRILFALANDVTGGNYLQVQSVACSVTDGNWHHVTLTYNGDSIAANCQFYLDGSPISKTVDADALSLSTVDTGVLYIGGNANVAGSYFTGFMDELAFYSKALTAGEVTWVYNGGVARSLADSGCPPNLAAWWRMGEGDTYPTILDSSGNGYSGTMQNMGNPNAFRYVQPEGSYSTHYLEFGGTDEYVSMGNVLDLARAGTARTYSFWFRALPDATSRTILGKYDGLQGVRIQVVGGSGVLKKGTDGSNYYLTNQRFDDGYWHHVCWWNDFPVIDGVQVQGSSSQFDNAANNAVAFCLGRSTVSVPSEYFVGGLDEVAVYGRNLSVAEAQWIFNNGSPRSLSDAGAPSGLLAWWRMGEAGVLQHNGVMQNMETTDIQWGGAAGCDGFLVPFDGYSLYALDGPGGEEAYLIPTPGAPPGPTTTLYYKMRAQDAGASPPGYVTWVVQDAPDFAGVGYSGGSPTPVGAMVSGSAVVAAEWEEVA